MKCSVVGCGMISHARGYCLKHYRHIQRHGKILNVTRYDKNVAFVHGGFTSVILRDSTGNMAGIMKIDTVDWEMLGRPKVCKSRNGYAVTRRDGKVRTIHRLILNVPEEMSTDHKNHDRLDNRRVNIRACTASENMRNRWCKGITFDKRKRKWMAQISLNGKHVFLGYFVDPDDAVSARRAAEKDHFGEFAFVGVSV